MKNTIKLLKDSICHVPLHSYQHDFTFIVNNEEYKTNKIVADLLSPKISKIHQIDPTFNVYSINTRSKGDFQLIFDLLSFNSIDLSDSNINFISEIMDNLEAERIDITIPDTELTVKNVIELIKKHEKSLIYQKYLIKEIDFLSEHFYELDPKQINKLYDLQDQCIINIINNDKLTLKSEDQLLNFIIELCSKNQDFSTLFEFVYFKNLSDEMILKFFTSFNIDYLTKETWMSLSKRFCKHDEKTNKNRYKNKFIEIPFSNNNMKGIFNFIRSKMNINEEIKVNRSSEGNGDENLLLNFENSQYIYINNKQNSWFCFDFKNHKIIPSHYSIKTIAASSNDRHLKNWIIEGSNDKENWTILDEQKNCSYLNGSNNVHSFQIDKQEKNEQEFEYLRIRQTGTNWYGDYYFYICSIEFYGKIYDME